MSPESPVEPCDRFRNANLVGLPSWNHGRHSAGDRRHGCRLRASRCPRANTTYGHTANSWCSRSRLPKSLDTNSRRVSNGKFDTVGQSACPQEKSSDTLHHLGPALLRNRANPSREQPRARTATCQPLGGPTERITATAARASEETRPSSATATPTLSSISSSETSGAFCVAPRRRSCSFLAISRRRRRRARLESGSDTRCGTTQPSSRDDAGRSSPTTSSRQPDTPPFCCPDAATSIGASPRSSPKILGLVQ